MLKQISEITKNATEIMAVTFFAVITVLVLVQVFFRFVLHNALPWPEEATRFLLIWAAHLSFNIIIIENLNINVAFFQDKLPSRVGDILKVIILLMQVVFFGVSHLVWILICPSGNDVQVTSNGHSDDYSLYCGSGWRHFFNFPDNCKNLRRQVIV